MKKLITAAAEWLGQGEDLIFATIIADSGSTPRGAGAHMAIVKGGDFVGTIGGGAVEYKVQQIAQEALMEKKSKMKFFSLSPNDVEDLGMICGGDVTVYIQYLSAQETGMGKLFQEMGALFDKNLESWLVIDVSGNGIGVYVSAEDGGSAGSMYSYSMMAGVNEAILERGGFSSRGVRLDIDGKQYYAEPLTRAGRVYIFGGGHVSQELCPLLAHLGFRCTVFDSLPQFADKALFPQAEEIILGDFENINAHVSIGATDYVVIMTRGHHFDFIIQAQALKRKPRYIGVIGSRKKIAAVSARLIQEGFTKEEIGGIHTPIGVDIKADTPAEIAVSIAGELIMVRSAR